MKAKRRMWITAAMVVAMTWAGSATAQGPMGHGPGHGGPGLGPGPMAGLDLTDAQREQMKALHEKRMAAMKPLMEEARASHEAFDQALEAESPDPTAVGEAALAMKAARDKLHAAHEAMRQDVEKILTDEQRAQLAQQHQQRGGRPGARGFGHHGGPSGPPPVEQ